jgi:pseudouridine-5'-phosphate glycosidase
VTSFVVGDDVRAALAAGQPVVALESTIFSRLGLPPPANAEALDRCVRAVRDRGAVPAVTAVLDGVARVGVKDAEIDRILASNRKTSARDLPVAVAQLWPTGVTTVSAALQLAAKAGIAVFATGGIGGVHRGAAETGDTSADLPAIAHHPVVTVSAGAKAFLDIARTLEHLETVGVPVLGLATDEFPAFYARASGLPVPHRVDTVVEAADVVRAGRAVGYPGGYLLVVPIPEADAIDPDLLDRAIEVAIAEAALAGVSGPAVTPFVLERITAATGGRSVTANIALAANNAGVAAELASTLLGS